MSQSSLAGEAAFVNDDVATGSSGDFSQRSKSFQADILYKKEDSTVFIRNFRIDNDVTMTNREGNSNNNNNSSESKSQLDNNNLKHVNSKPAAFIPQYLTFVDDTDDTCNENRTKLDCKTVADRVRTFCVHDFSGAHNDDANERDALAERLLQRIAEKNSKIIDKQQSTTNSKRILCCFACRRDFSSPQSFIDHVTRVHTVSANQHEEMLLQKSTSCALLQKEDDDCVMCFLEPTSNDSGSLDHMECYQHSNGIVTPTSKVEDNKVRSDSAVSIESKNKVFDIDYTSNKSNFRVKIIEEDQPPTSEDHLKAGPSVKLEQCVELGSTHSDILPTAATSESVSDHQKTCQSKHAIVTSQQVLGSHQDEQGVLDLSSPAVKVSAPSAATTNSETISSLKEMSFAVASPIATHTSSPTSRQMLLNNAMRSDTLNQETKMTLVESPDTKKFSPKLEPQENMNEIQAFISKSVRSIMASQSESASVSISPSATNVSSAGVPDAPQHPSPRTSSLSNTHSNMDMLMSTTPSSNEQMFPMSLFQSRNSCKTLKCPKCNWHYKYRQTLEAHMKEKHLEETSDCGYCNAGQPHPRLSRGESYSCGYKPFKCNVCNYSTTTKGNLSIHMQSDKHLYNARTIQQKQDRSRQDGSSSTTFSIPRNENSLRESSLKQNRSPNKLLPNYDDTMMDMKGFNISRRRRSSAKTNSSIDSGTFSAPSKTTSPIQGRRESGSGGKWRCDVCLYETSIARNLRIHMTSEKHAQNLALREREMRTQHNSDEESSRSRSDRHQSNDVSHVLPFANNQQTLMDYYTNAFKSLQQDGRYDVTSRSFPLPDEGEKLRKAQAQYLQQQLYLAQQQQLLLAQQYQQIMMAAAAASSLQQRFTSQSKDDDVSTSDGVSTHGQEKSQQANNVNSWHIFTCGLCGVYGADDITTLEAHVRKPRHNVSNYDLINNEWVTRSQREGYFCKLCNYSTPLKTNFNLHCKTEKHTLKLNLIFHVREGGPATEWMIPHVISGNITQSVSCNACQYTAQSVEKLKLHCSTEQHQGVYTVCQYLHTVLKSRSGVDEKQSNFRLKCLACGDYSTKFIVEMVKHMQTTDHQLQLQSHKNPPMTTLQDVIAFENTEHENEQCDDVISPKANLDKEARCEFCNFVTDDDERMRHHLMTQHSDQPPSQCPLCQELLKTPIQLQLHLITVHKLPIMDDAGGDAGASSFQDALVDIKNRSLSTNQNTDQQDNISEDANDLPGELKIVERGRDQMMVDGEDEDVEALTGQLVSSSETKDLSSRDGEVVRRDTQEEHTDKNMKMNSLILKVLKGQTVTGNTIAKAEPSTLENIIRTNLMAQPRKESNSPLMEDLKESMESEEVFSHKLTSDAVSRSCPDLLVCVGDSSKPTNYVDLQCGRQEVKIKRTRMRSYPLDGGSRSRTYRQLLSKYGLEQAQQYIENRSLQNREKARSFKLEKRKWSSVATEATLDDDMTSSKRKYGDDKSLRQDVEELKPDLTSDDSPKACQHCGKEFTSLWVLKVHEEEAHGVCVPAQNIHKVASAYSDQFWEKSSLNSDTLASNKENVKAADEQSTSSGNLPGSDLVDKALAEKMAVAEGATMQQLQQQAILKALLNVQANKQNLSAGVQPENQFDNLNQSMYLGDPMTSNLVSQMGIYSSLLQAQATGLAPYQLLANAAAVQQMQQLALAGNPMVGALEDKPTITGTNVFNASHLLNGGTVGNSSKQNRTTAFENLQKQDVGKQMQNSTHQVQMMQKNNSMNADIPAKRPRTRITDEQLKVLRANFDINNSPSEEQIDEMASLTTLPPKVIKHWFRNTLFKERQRSKDSPYNFNIPPITSLDDAYKTSSSKGEVVEDEAVTGMQEHDDASNDVPPTQVEHISSDLKSDLGRGTVENARGQVAMATDSSCSGDEASSEKKIKREQDENLMKDLKKQEVPQSIYNNALALVPNFSSSVETSQGIKLEDRENLLRKDVKPQHAMSTHMSIPQQLINPIASWQALTQYESNSNNDSLYYNDCSSLSETGAALHAQSGSCRRTPRTRFTDFQLQVLQNFFDRNAYPKDDDLDKLSRTLNLSTRVIVVWFQNARQKARKSYEQQQHPGMNRISPSMIGNSSFKVDSVDVMEKARDVQQRSSPQVEDLARKALSEVTKNISGENKLSFNEENINSMMSSSKLFSSDRSVTKQPTIPSSAASTGRFKSSDTEVSLPCNMCDQTFSTPEQWQNHQQQHLAANMASMLGPYGLMYMQGLVGNSAQTNIGEKSMLGLQEESSKSSGGNRDRNSTWNKAKHDSTSSFSLFQNGRSIPEDKSIPGIIRSRLVTPPISGASKRKMSTSPTLSYSSSSSTSPSAAHNSAARMKGNFMDDKEQMGIQKDPKRLRTTITPEQLEYLYQQYLVDSSPSRKTIEQISEIVGLKKRVVQVWFQNTRARERKGQFRSSVVRGGTGLMSQYKACHVCRLVLRNQSELDVHLCNKHDLQKDSKPAIETPASKKFKYDTVSGLERPTPGLNTDRPISMDIDAIQKLTNAMKPERFLQNDKAAITEAPAAFMGGHNSSDSKSFFTNVNSSNELKKKLTALFQVSSIASSNQPTHSSDVMSPFVIPKRSTSPLHQESLIKTPPSPLASSPISQSLPLFGVDVQKAPNLTSYSTSSSSQSEDTESIYSSASQIKLSPTRKQMSNFFSTISGTSEENTPSKRHRTQMTSNQVRALKKCFKICKMPSLVECDLLGSEVGLQKRVVQVWFQNARAKEKKHKLHNHLGGAEGVERLDEENSIPMECDICFPTVCFTSSQHAKNHVFSPAHLQRLLKAVEDEKRNELLSNINTPQSSPNSSCDGFENQFFLDQTGESYVEDRSPSHASRDRIVNETEEIGHDEVTDPSREDGESWSSDEKNAIKSTPVTSSVEEQISKKSAHMSAPSSEEEFALLLARNPQLLHHYRTIQQMALQRNSENEANEMESQQQVLLQEAFQKSVYQILQLNQASSAETQ